jgi:orotidine-5'-phosphate decarboxylase
MQATLPNRVPDGGSGPRTDPTRPNAPLAGEVSAGEIRQGSEIRRVGEVQRPGSEVQRQGSEVHSGVHSDDPRQRLIVALDVSTSAAARKIVAAVGNSALTYKVGMQLYTAEGPPIVRDLVASGRRVFLDLKYHDIPNTVQSAVAEAAKLGVSMLTVHASGGAKMLRAAVDAARARPGMMVLAVTVLTSMDENDLETIGMSGSVADSVVRLATMARANGCQGIVASAREASKLRAELGSDFAIVTPGVRPAGGTAGDQKRVVTPAEAIAAGASHIVVGRPITDAIDPAAAARAIMEQISG